MSSINQSFFLKSNRFKKSCFGMFSFFILLSGCTSLRMKYEGDVTTKDGKKAKVVAEKSYDLGNADSTMCMITGIFMGGYCWYYTVMPTTLQRQTMEEDVRSALNEYLNSSEYELSTVTNDKINWEMQEDSFRLEFFKRPSFKNKHIKE